jgi:hypothetical protein
MQLFALRRNRHVCHREEALAGIKAQHITVKGAAFFEVSSINGDMIKNRLV